LEICIKTLRTRYLDFCYFAKSVGVVYWNGNLLVLLELEVEVLNKIVSVDVEIK